MPLYDFECEPCAYYTEIQKVFINAPHTFVRGEAKTIGQLAEHNYKNMGFYEKQDRKIKDQLENSEVKNKRERHQKIISMTPEQQTKWIREGD